MLTLAKADVGTGNTVLNDPEFLAQIRTGNTVSLRIISRDLQELPVRAKRGEGETS